MDEETIQMIKKVCRVEIVFPVISDEQALIIKQTINKALEDIKNKRFTFQIVET